MGILVRKIALVAKNKTAKMQCRFPWAVLNTAKNAAPPSYDPAATQKKLTFVA